ncbi:MAG: hypothetical protein IAA73_07735 [Bacteroidetes bacterium]|uniref:Uncharacterized protein n=1 Tax=Candidatus Gallipaludibacter merdavium TaxID=2840839 RepID=A0A9D9N4Q2_9BACT|nr:hypothetical protein [Candidatus Gallipaludibacter merdavium]
MFLSYVVQAQEMYKVVPLNNLQEGDRVILSVKRTDGFMYPLTNGELRFGKEGTELPYGESSVWWIVERNGSYLRFKNLATNSYLAVEEWEEDKGWGRKRRKGTLLHKANGTATEWELISLSGSLGISLRNKKRGNDDIGPVLGDVGSPIYYDITPAVPSNGTLFSLTNSINASHTNRTPFVGIILLPNSPNRFQHYVGHTETSLDARGLQKVHEFHQDVYLAPNEQIRLVSPNYRSFYHYARWFDYGNESGDNTDGQLLYPEFVFDQIPSTVEIEEYTIGGTVIFNKQEPAENSYTTYPLYTMQGEQARQVALEQSLYMNYVRGTIKMDGVEYSTLKEPTLSQRMVFNIRPAKEMADRLSICVGNDNYLEEYNLIAPVGRTIYIGPQYEFNGGKFPNYYVLHNGTLVNLKSGTWRWYREGSQQAMDIANNRFVKAVSNTSTTTYTLRCTYGGTTYNVARFVVQFVPADQVGPYEGLGEGQLVGLDLLTEEHFNFTQPGSSVVSYYNYPFAAEESTYGFHYHDLQEDGLRADKASTTWGVAKGPYWSEYAFINSTATIELDFLHSIANRDGVSLGYFLYVDGSETPGNVFRLSIPATLCPGGTMYFSAYVASLNNGSSAAAPNLDFIVLGYDTDGNEHVLTTYTTGEFGNGSAGSGNEAGKWLHVLFPVTIEGGVEYTNFALRITNKGKNSTGNDFAIDDIEIYASKPALMVSQASIGIDECYETEGDEIWTFLRVDYLAAQLGGNNLYYQWTNTNDFSVLPMEYYGESEDNNYGAIVLPQKDEDFTNGVYPTFASITEFDTYVKQSSLYNAIGYIKEKNAEGTDQYMLYIATKGYLSPGYLYTAYISTDPNNLQTATCGWSSDLRIVGKAYVEMNDGIILPADPYKVEGNRIHYLKVKMQTTEGGLQVYTPKAAWLWGDEALVNQNQSIYGGTYDEVCAAIQAVINNDPGKTQEQEDMVDKLVNVEHLLTLNVDSLEVYVMANDVDRQLAYTAFPMKNTISQGVRVCLEPLTVLLSPFAFAPVTRVGYTIPSGLELPNLVSATPRVVRVNPSRRKEGHIDIPFVFDGDVTCSVEVRPLDAEADGITANFDMEPLSSKMVALNGISGLTVGKDYLFEVVSQSMDITDQYSYFILRILPDEVKWNSTRLSGDQWNKDAYWEPAFVPTSDMNVILPSGAYTIPQPVSEDKQKEKLEEGAQPYITYDIYYEPYSCKNIYIPENTTLLNQELLRISGQAYVDITVPTNTWTLISTPITGVVSGDFWIPAEGNSQDAFDIRTINQETGTRAEDRLNNQVWQSIYNGESIIYGDYNRVVTSSEWSTPTNALNAPYEPGSGLALWAMSDNATQTFRMPKSDTEYKFYYDYSEKWTDNQMVSIDRSTSGRFAYATASSSYTLRNNSASKTFLFGNPTMAYIDLKKFAEENNLPGGFIELVPGESTTLELSQTVDGLSNTGRSLDYLPPYRAVLFEAADTEGTELEVVVTADMLGHAPTTGQSMSVKRMRTDNNESLMYISASTVDYVSRALVAERAGASDWVVKGEDAELLLLDGYKTPFGIYTLCEDKSLVINQMNGAEEIPLCLYVQPESSLVDYVELTFNGSADFLSQWQLYDVATDFSVDLYDGCSLQAEMPVNGGIRYLLKRKSQEGGSSPTTELFQVWNENGQLLLSAPKGLDRLFLTDMAGRVILEKKGMDDMLQINLQSGVYLIYGSLGDVVYTKPIIVR